jgi:hypothetical protein
MGLVGGDLSGDFNGDVGDWVPFGGENVVGVHCNNGSRALIRAPIVFDCSRLWCSSTIDQLIISSGFAEVPLKWTWTSFQQLLCSYLAVLLLNIDNAVSVCDASLAVIPSALLIAETWCNIKLVLKYFICDLHLRLSLFLLFVLLQCKWMYSRMAERQ